MRDLDAIIKTEYSPEFDELRKNRMLMSYFKYGPLCKNYGDKLVDAVKNIKRRLDLYEETHNTEHLVDVANFAMIEYMFPKYKDAHYRATDSDESPGLVGGMSINEIKSWEEN